VVTAVLYNNIKLLSLLTITLMFQKNDSRCIPEAAIGCPKAIAPPQIFTLFGSISSSRRTATDWAANASFNSNKSTSSLFQPAFFS